jgi:hypothetical protein
MRFLQSLTESVADYTAMINPVLAALNAPKANGIADDLHGGVSDKINAIWKSEIEQARANLKKADRITWYLRLVRANLIYKFSKVIDAARIAKVVGEYNTRSGVPVEQDGFDGGILGGMSDALIDLSHFLSLPIPEIQNYAFRFQSFTEVIGDFKEAERKWQSVLERTIADDGAKVIIDCGKNWFWVNLEKAYCSKEAAAMGHCGNSPRKDSSDTILSLRKKIMMGPTPRWEPHLTFIMESDGYLSEMKGRANDKPTEKYHPMIVKLLENDIIKGMRGGGYRPENNFSMADLPDGERDRLINMKPELGNAYDLFQKLGPSDEVFDRVYRDLAKYRLDLDSYDGDTVTLETWDGLDRFFRDAVYDDSGEKLATMGMDGYFEDGWLDFDFEDSSKEILKAIADENDDFLEQLAKKVGTREESAIDALLHMFPNSLPAIWNESKGEVQKLALEAAKRKLKNISPAARDVRLSVNADGSKVRATMDFIALVVDLTNHEENHEDGSDGFDHAAKEGSWVFVDDWGNDDSDDLEANTMAQDIYSTANPIAIKHIMGLFHDHDAGMDF